MTEPNKSGFSERSLADLRERFESAVTSLIADSHIIELSNEHRQPNLSFITFENTNGELLVALLESPENEPFFRKQNNVNQYSKDSQHEKIVVLQGISVVQGSYCGGKQPEMAILQQMDIPYSKAMGTVRFEFQADLTERQIDEVVENIKEAVALARSFNQ